MVKNPRTGRTPKDDLEESALGFLGDVVEAGLEDVLLCLDRFGKSETRIAGTTNSKFSSAGAEEYAVVAKRIAATLSKKSARNAAGLYGVKKFCRDCRADHSRAADCLLSVAYSYHEKKTYRSNQSNENDFRYRAAREIGYKGLFS